MSLKIVVDRHTPLAAEAFSTVGEVVTVETGGFTPLAVRDADAIIVRSETKVGAGLLDGSRVRFVGTTTIGTDHIDTAWLDARGIAFASAPGCNANSVCEYVLAALLHLCQKHRLRLDGLTLGIVGVGNIGAKVERMAAALGMQVLVNDPPLARQTRDPKYRHLDALMMADVITIHVPLTSTGPDATRHCFDATRMASMKRGALLLNASRGPVVVNKDLKEALRSAHLAGAVLDVWEGEPALDPELLAAVDIGTPHIAGYSYDGKTNAVKIVYDALCLSFDLNPVWSIIEDRLPRPAHPTVEVSPADMSIEKTLRAIVPRCYDIVEDDRQLRSTLSLPAEKCPGAFQHLRTGYRVRREFRATRVVGAQGPLRNVLKTLGFSI